MISELFGSKTREHVSSGPSGTTDKFDEVVAGMVALSAPRLFAIVQQYGVGVDVRIAAWGMATGDTAEIVTVEGRRFAVSPLEAVVPCFERGPDVVSYLVWVEDPIVPVTSVRPAGCGPTGEDPGVLRLRAEAALTLIPLISRVVVDRSDRRVVVADAVDRWLALPAGARHQYSQMTGSEDDGLERFCWDFVDTVEQETLPPGDGGPSGPVESQSITVDAVEQILITRWQQYLRRTLHLANAALREEH